MVNSSRDDSVHISQAYENVFVILEKRSLGIDFAWGSIGDRETGINSIILIGVRPETVSKVGHEAYWDRFIQKVLQSGYNTRIFINSPVMPTAHCVPHPLKVKYYTVVVDFGLNLRWEEANKFVKLVKS